MSEPTPGGESYPLEVPGEDTPLGADPPAAWPPCPDCGAPRRLPEPVCLQCGLDERSPAADGEALAPAAPATSAEASGPDKPEEAATPGRPSDANRDPELAPLLRPWPGGERLVWIAAIVVLGLLGAGALSGTSGFPPAFLPDEGALSAFDQARYAVRMVAAAGFWALAGWGVCLGLAWGQDRPVGGRAALGGRMLLAAAASRLAILLPVADPAVAFFAEGFVALAILAGGMWGALRVPALIAAAVAAITALVIGSAGLVAHVVSWTVA